MKIRVLSDLHLEFWDWVPPKSDADIIVLAGDIHVGVRGVEWARRSFPMSPVVYVPENPSSTVGMCRMCQRSCLCGAGGENPSRPAQMRAFARRAGIKLPELPKESFVGLGTCQRE
jgi:hypothetical protein